MRSLFFLLPVLLLAACKPESTGKQPDPPAETVTRDPAKHDDYLGLDEESAGTKADQAGVKWRVISVDGQPRAVTMDYRPDRLNFTIEGGKVIRVTNG